MNDPAEVARHLDATTVPTSTVASLLAELPAWWFNRERPEIVASDVALCHPQLAEDEVRAIIWPATDPAFCRLTLVAWSDRPLVSALAATVASHGLLVERAAAAPCRSVGLTLVRATLRDPDGRVADDTDWERFGADIKRAAVTGGLPDVAPVPLERLMVERRLGADGEQDIVVTAAHRVGTLWTVCSWLQAHGCQIEAVQTESTGDIRRSIFIVSGTVDVTALAHDLRAPSGGWAPTRLVTAALGRLPRPRAPKPGVPRLPFGPPTRPPVSPG